MGHMPLRAGRDSFDDERRRTRAFATSSPIISHSIPPLNLKPHRLRLARGAQLTLAFLNRLLRRGELVDILGFAGGSPIVVEL